MEKTTDTLRSTAHGGTIRAAIDVEMGGLYIEPDKLKEIQGEISEHHPSPHVRKMFRDLKRGFYTGQQLTPKEMLDYLDEIRKKHNDTAIQQLFHQRHTELAQTFHRESLKQNITANDMEQPLMLEIWAYGVHKYEAHFAMDRWCCCECKCLRKFFEKFFGWSLFIGLLLVLVIGFVTAKMEDSVKNLELGQWAMVLFVLIPAVFVADIEVAKRCVLSFDFWWILIGMFSMHVGYFTMRMDPENEEGNKHLLGYQIGLLVVKFLLGTAACLTDAIPRAALSNRGRTLLFFAWGSFMAYKMFSLKQHEEDGFEKPFWNDWNIKITCGDLIKHGINVNVVWWFRYTVFSIMQPDALMVLSKTENIRELRDAQMAAQFDQPIRPLENDEVQDEENGRIEMSASLLPRPDCPRSKSSGIYNNINPKRGPELGYDTAVAHTPDFPMMVVEE